MIKRFILNETSYFGRGSKEKIITELSNRNLKKIMLVTDEGLIKLPVIKKITDVLDRENVDYKIFSKVIPNPTVEIVEEGIAFVKKNNIDSIIAVGGGSSIDTAKAIGIITNNKEFSDVVSLQGLTPSKNKSLPIIALPTTAGTAAEVTINYVITDNKTKKKMVCVDPNDIPVVAIIDPELMDDMPASVAAATGMDALTHAIEGYITKDAWYMSDMYHLNAISLIYKNLADAVNLKDKRAIDQVGYGQYIAGMGFSNVGLGIVHSLAHPLGAHFDTPHGTANALLLPHVLEYNQVACPEKFINIATAMGLVINGLTTTEIVNLVINKIRELSEKINIPKTLREINIPEDALEILAKDAFNDVCTPGNPRETSIEELLEIYKKAY